MPDEAGRITKNKKVQLPSGSTVIVPVISEISFVDPIEHAQEFQFTVDNSAEADRDTHVAWVAADVGSTNATENADPQATVPEGVIAVERLDLWRVLDVVAHGQETFLAPESKTFDSNGPPYFTTHEKTHVVRYVNSPDDGNWIESELIDEIRVSDPVEQGQETFYSLDNPPGEDDGHGNFIVAADPSLDDITDAAPWRLDPFQNIVKFSDGTPLFSISFLGIEQITGRENSVLQYWTEQGDTTQTDTGVSVNDPAPDGEFPTDKNVEIFYINKIPIVFHQGGFAPGYTDTTVPPMTGSPSGGFATIAPWTRGTSFVDPGPGTIVTGPPLVVNGKPIIGFLGTLTASYDVYLAAMTGPQTYDFPFPGPYRTTPVNNGHWLAASVGQSTPAVVVGGPSISALVGTVTMTVSGSPFTFNGQQWKAVGLDGSVNTTKSNAIQVWCIRA